VAIFERSNPAGQGARLCHALPVPALTRALAAEMNAIPVG